MLIKSIDDKAPAISTLESLLEQSNPAQKKRVEEEIRLVRSGFKGEQEAAYLIDFDFKKSENTAIIHDLRLEVDGRVAQIDHLLIHRTLKVFVLETKHFHAGLKITDDGEFLRWNDWKKTFEGMPSPLAQNERHITVLKDIFAQIEMPSRLGMRIDPTFHSVVLVTPKSRIDRSKKFDSSQVIKADVLADYVEKDLDKQSMMTALSRIVGSDTLEQIARRLIALHRPVSINYKAKFGVIESPVSEMVSRTKAIEQVTLPEVISGKHVCRACSSEKLSIQHGKFGYYFKCAECESNTPIKIGCANNGHKERIRKDGLRFFRACAECGSTALFFENPE